MTRQRRLGGASLSPGRMADTGEMRREETRSYAGFVERVRSLVERYVPPGSTVAVVSRGDPAMLELGERVGWHVPSSPEGRYVGYHPADGPDAVRAVESVRERGAEFLLVPDTTSWWLSHYEGLREHLEGFGPPLVVEPETATLFALSSRASLLDPEGTERARVIDDLAEIAGLLLPRGAAVTIIDGEPALTASLAAFEVTLVAPDAVTLSALGSTWFLVVPCWHYSWLAQREDVREELARKARLVTWQQHVAAVYEFTSLGQEASP